MRIFLPTGLNINMKDFLRKAGYSSFIDPFTQRMSFKKTLTRHNYPRLHIYLEKNTEGQTYLSLHLDQKKPSYPGAHSHSAEYDGEMVEREAKRLNAELQARDKLSFEPKQKRGFKIFEKLFSK